MRRTFKKLGSKDRHGFRAEFVQLEDKPALKGLAVVVVLRNVRLRATGERIANRVSFSLGTAFQRLGRLVAGDVIEFDARVVDGAVNGTALSTVGSSFISGIFDLRVVDGMVNLVGTSYDVASRWFRRLQVGFTQGYAMVMVFGAAILLGVFYLIKL